MLPLVTLKLLKYDFQLANKMETVVKHLFTVTRLGYFTEV